MEETEKQQDIEAAARIARNAGKHVSRDELRAAVAASKGIGVLVPGKFDNQDEFFSYVADSVEAGYAGKIFSFYNTGSGRWEGWLIDMDPDITDEEIRKVICGDESLAYWKKVW